MRPAKPVESPPPEVLAEAMNMMMDKARKHIEAYMAGQKAKEEEKVEETTASQPPLKEFTVTSNGVTMCLSLRREEKVCVVDVKRSGSYKSFSDLCDLETSVKVKCRQSRFFVPTEMQIDTDSLQRDIVYVVEG